MPGACNTPKHILLVCPISPPLLSPLLLLFVSLLPRSPYLIDVQLYPPRRALFTLPRDEREKGLLRAGLNAKYELDTVTVCLPAGLVDGSAASWPGSR